jgi:hypothetical protein
VPILPHPKSTKPPRATISSILASEDFGGKLGATVSLGNGDFEGVFGRVI